MCACVCVRMCVRVAYCADAAETNGSLVIVYADRFAIEKARPARPGQALPGIGSRFRSPQPAPAPLFGE